MAVFTHHKKFMTRKVDEVDNKPVYAFACGREENIIVHEARLVDYLLIEGVYVPVYAIARECCLGIEEELIYGCVVNDADPVLLFSDDFEDTDSTNLTEHIPSFPGAILWNVISGAWEIAGGDVRPTTAAATTCLAVANVSVGDVEIFYTVAATGGVKYGAALRINDSDGTGWRIWGRTDGGDNNVYLDLQTGTLDNHASAAHTWAVNDLVRIRAEGDSIKVYINATLLIDYTTPTSFNQTQPNHGIVRDAVNITTPRMDDFAIYTLVPEFIGIPKTMRAIVYVNELTATNQHCGAPECDSFTLTHNGTSWVGGSAVMTEGSLSFALTCQPEADPSERWKLEITGCSPMTLYRATTFNGCNALYLAGTLIDIDGDACCGCPQITPKISFYIEALGNQWVRMARLIDYVQSGENYLPVYGFAECCDDEGVTYAPRCCVRLPCTIYAEITSSCACLNGAMVTLNFVPWTGFPAPTHSWSGSVVLECGTISVSVICDTNGTLDQEFVPTEENPCQELVICEPQGYGTCDEPRYLSGNFSVGVRCGDILFGQVEVLCNECDCDPFSAAFDLIFAAGSPACGCDEEDTVSVQLSI